MRVFRGLNITTSTSRLRISQTLLPVGTLILAGLGGYWIATDSVLVPFLRILIVLLILSILGVRLLKRHHWPVLLPEDVDLYRWLYIMVPVKLALVAAVWGYRLTTGYTGERGDEIAYAKAAMGLVQAWLRGDFNLDVPLMAEKGYVLVLAVIYLIAGFGDWVPRLLQVGLGVATALFAYRIARMTFGRSSARIVFLLILLYPDYIYWDTFLLRETWASCMALFIMWRFLSWRASGRFRRTDVVITGAVLAWLALTKVPAAMALAAAAMSVLVMESVSKGRWRRAVFILIFGLSALQLGSSLSGFSNLGIERADTILAGAMTSEVYGGRAYLRETLFETFQAIAASPFSFGLAMYRTGFGVFLGTLTLANPDLYIFPELFRLAAYLLQWALVPAIAYGTVMAWRKNRWPTMLIISYIAVAMVSFTLWPNDLTRQRLVIIPQVFLLAAIGLTHWQEWRQIYPLYILFVGHAFLTRSLDIDTTLIIRILSFMIGGTLLFVWYIRPAISHIAAGRGFLANFRSQKGA